MRSFLWTSLAALIGGLLASYARPEYFLAYVLFSSAFVLVLFLQRTTILARSHLTALLVFGIFSALLLGVAGLPVGNRSMMAFGQHFSFNWVAWSGSNLNPWTNWEEILSRNFGSANGIPEAFLHNPSAFLAHITENFRKLLSTSSTLVLPTIFPAYRLSKIIAAFLIISLFVAYSSNVRNNLVERKRPLAVIGLFLLPALASAIVIYPRDHYLFLMSVLMVIFTAVLLARYPPRQKQADHNQLLLIALLLIALTPYFADQTGAKRSNLDTIRFIESLGISKPVNLLEAEGGYHIYLGDNFHRVAEDDKNSGFGRFLADRSINMIVVTATLLEDARFHDDLEWLEFLANHRRSEYVQMDVPNTETRLIVRADLLSR
jgi:hypothetical protein